MKITNIKMKQVHGNNSNIKALVSLELDNCLVIHGLTIVEYTDGKKFIRFPNKKITMFKYDDKSSEYTPAYGYTDIVHPNNQEFRTYIEKEVFKIYDQVKVIQEQVKDVIGGPLSE